MNVKQMLIELSDAVGNTLPTLYHKAFMWFAGTSLVLNIGDAADDYLPSWLSDLIQYVMQVDYVAFFSALAVILLCIERALVLGLRVRRILNGDYSVEKPGE
jgi:hypothetical protein